MSDMKVSWYGWRRGIDRIYWLRVIIKIKSVSIFLLPVYNLFETLNEKFCIKRMKGLGEMDRKHLSLTCLDPITRTYMTIRSPGDVDNIFRLLGVDTKLRKDLVFKNVKN